MNTWIGTGRLTRDPQMKTYGPNNDKKMARFTIACDRRGKKEEGQQTADFIPCICYGGTADFVDKYLRQGTKIIVTGTITTGKYENKDGQTVYTTDILVSNVEFAESKRTSDQAQTAPKAAATPDSNGTPDFMHIPDGAEEQLPWQ